MLIPSVFFFQLSSSCLMRLAKDAVELNVLRLEDRHEALSPGQLTRGQVLASGFEATLVAKLFASQSLDAGCQL